MSESFAYKRAIACLAQRIIDSRKTQAIIYANWHETGKLYDKQFNLWETAQTLCPELTLMAKDVDAELNYELSYSQCCNAVKWACIYEPFEWSHLLQIKQEEYA